MSFISQLKRFWKFLNEDTWQSWVVSLILAFIVIKFIFFPGLSYITGSPLPLVVVESCSMYHAAGFEGWWEQNRALYMKEGISKQEFEDFTMKNGLNKGDIILVYGRGDYSVGDIIIFNSAFRNPIIHRLIDVDPYGTKGDNNPGQLDVEKKIEGEAIIGKAVARVPLLGWIKLIFFESSRPKDERGFC